MDRRSFLKMCAVLGFCPIALQSGDAKAMSLRKIDESVIIVGAGAAGLTAGYWLQKAGAQVTILEAAGVVGGRMKVDRDFADFPIPLGAEWLHVSPKVFSQISGRDAGVETIGYDRAETYMEVRGSRVSTSKLGHEPDRKFLNSSWLDFFEQFVLPDVRSQIMTGQEVSSVKRRGSRVIVSTRQGLALEADRVIVTVPLKILKEGGIQFEPGLPRSKARAIAAAKPWPGLKLFIEFSEKFYPVYVSYAVSPASAGHKLYYDAAYGQKTDRNILGLFTVGTPALAFSKGDAVKMALKELDELFEGAASRSYVKHRVQDWTREPHIRSAYIRDNENYKTVQTLQKPVARRIFFAGECYTDGEDWGAVHNAARSAMVAVRRISKGG